MIEFQSEIRRYGRTQAADTMETEMQRQTQPPNSMETEGCRGVDIWWD